MTLTQTAISHVHVHHGIPVDILLSSAERPSPFLPHFVLVRWAEAVEEKATQRPYVCRNCAHNPTSAKTEQHREERSNGHLVDRSFNFWNASIHFLEESPLEGFASNFARL